MRIPEKRVRTSLQQDKLGHKENESTTFVRGVSEYMFFKINEKQDAQTYKSLFGGPKSPYQIMLIIIAQPLEFLIYNQVFRIIMNSNS